MKPMRPPFCLWEEYQRTGEYRDMLRWLKHRAYCYATEPERDEVAPWLLEAAACFQPGDADLLRWMRTAEGDAGDGSLEEVHDAIESLLTRMEKAAEIMEGQE